MEFLNRIKDYKNQIYREICTILLFGGLFGVFHGFFGVKEPGRREGVFIVSLMIYLFLFTVFRLKGRAFLIAIAGVLCVVEGVSVGTEGCKLALSSYIEWLFLGGGKEEYLAFYVLAQILWLILGCMMYAFVLSISKKIRYASCVLAVGVLIGFLVTHMQVTRAAAAFWLVFLLLQVSEILEEYWVKKRVVKDRQAAMVWLWPVWTLFLVGMLLVPSSKDPYQWTFVKKAITRVGDELTVFAEKIRLGNGEGFEMRMSGFSKEGNLGGNLEETDKEVLFIQSSKTMVTNLYLDGIIMDTFDGREWKEGTEETLKERRLDVLETYFAVSDDESHRISDYLSTLKLNITYGHLASSKYFWPLKSMEFYGDNIDLLTDTKEAQKLLQKRKKYRDTYAVTYYQMNLHQNVFDELLEKEKIVEDETCAKRWETICRKYGTENFTYEDLLNYREKNRQIYGEKPKLSDDMKAWVEEVTKDSEGGYKKLCAIESALQSLTYETSPGELPKEVNSPATFLDHFVLEQKSGYCTYFATAMTLLARYEGYPARYVQGFCVPMKGKKEYSVKSRMSHAWCEVYFDGIGWIPFEPTGGYGEMRYTPWALYVQQDADMPDFSVRPEKHTEDVVEEVKEDEEKSVEFSEKRRRMILITVALLAVAAGFILLFDIILGRRSYQKKNLRERYRYEAERNIVLLRKLGVKRKPHETLQELGTRMAAQYGEWEEECPVFLSYYEEVLYGDLPVSEQMIDLVRKERKKMLTHLNKWARIKEQYYFLKTSGTGK